MEIAYSLRRCSSGVSGSCRARPHGTPCRSADGPERAHHGDQGGSAVPARGVVSTGYISDRPPLAGTPTVTLQLSGLVIAVQPGPTYPGDLTFADAGTIRLELPVVEPVDSSPQR